MKSLYTFLMLFVCLAGYTELRAETPDQKENSILSDNIVQNDNQFVIDKCVSPNFVVNHQMLPNSVMELENPIELNYTSESEFRIKGKEISSFLVYRKARDGLSKIFS